MRKIILLNLLIMCVWAQDVLSHSTQEKDCQCGAQDCPEDSQEKESKETSQEELRESSGAK